MFLSCFVINSSHSVVCLLFRYGSIENYLEHIGVSLAISERIKKYLEITEEPIFENIEF